MRTPLLRYTPEEWIGKKVIVTVNDGTFIIGQLINVWEVPTLEPKDEALVLEDFTGEVYLITDQTTSIELYSDDAAAELDEDRSNLAKHRNRQNRMAADYPEPNINVSDETLRRFHRGMSTEEELVRFIRNYLLTEEQRMKLFRYDLSVEDVLNGRYTEEAEDYILQELFPDWNQKLNIVGHKNRFGF